MESKRLALGVEYDGSAFHGWQSQGSGVRTVQDAIQRALSVVAAHPISVVCAGRTDAGVHANGQVIHFDSSASRSQRAWTMGVNSNLPDDVAVRWAEPVSNEFHARFSATGRRYRYQIFNHRFRSPLIRQHAAWIHQPLDSQRMHDAGQALLGENDFGAYRAAGCQSNSPWRNLQQLEVARSDDCVTIEVEANAFLHHMVRNIVGVLIAVGSGDRPIDWPAEVLASRDRRRGGITAPAAGLCLIAVRYPARHGVPGGGSMTI